MQQSTRVHSKQQLSKMSTTGMRFFRGTTVRESDLAVSVIRPNPNFLYLI